MMRITRVAFVGLVLLLVGCIRFNPQDVCDRDGEVDAWLSETTIRVQTINTASSLTDSDLEDLYNEQAEQKTPACLETAQAYAVESFPNQWEAAKAMENNDVTGSVSYLAQSATPSSRMAREIERLAELNDWRR